MKTGKILNNHYLIITTCLFFVWFFISCSFSQKTCKKLLNQSISKSYDVVIVPGFPFENEKWSPTIKGRVYWAKFLYDKGIAKNIMFSGSAVYTPYIEADIMALYAEAIGVPREHILTETKAEHSTENIYYSYKKARKMGFSTFAIASDPFQAKWLKKFTRKIVSKDIYILPFVFDTLKVMSKTMTDPLIDYKKTFVADFISLPDRENIWKRLKGTKGKDLNTSLYE